MTIAGLDHIIYATPDLASGMKQVAALTGVEPVPGGSHPGRGTQNALFSLGPDTYVEILAPDPAQPPEALALAAERIPAASRIVTWAVKCDDLEEALNTARAGNLDLGRIESMSRALPYGGTLAWRLTRGATPADGLVPFLIDWGDSAHPALTAPAGCSLRHLRAEHPDPASVQDCLALLGLQDVLEVSRGPAPRIVAGLSTPKGDIELT